MQKIILLYSIFFLLSSCSNESTTSETPTATATATPILRATSPQKKKRTDPAFNKERYQSIAKQKFNIDIEEIYFGHNKTGITAVLVNTEKKLSKTQLTTLQENLNTVFSEYRSAINQTIVKRKGQPYALIRTKKSWDDNWIAVHDYQELTSIMAKRVKEFKTFKAEHSTLSKHEIVGVYYSLHSLPKDELKDDVLFTVMSKDPNGVIFSYIFGRKNGDLWGYRKEDNKYYSTGNRSDHQIRYILDNGDLLSLSLYYFEEGDERYGSYFLSFDF